MRDGRPARVISGSFTIESLDIDEHSRGRMAARTLERLDLGFGVPKEKPKLL